MSAAAFFEADGDTYQATELTRGPWHKDLQHAGPPSALLARAIEQQAADMPVVRLSIDLLKAVPITALRVSVQERVGGKRRRILSAELRRAEDDTVLASAQALLLRREAIELPPQPSHDPATPKVVADSAPFEFGFFTADTGYHTAMELRLAAGGLGTGATFMWMRARVPLLAGETLSPLQRVMLVADSGNGVSLVLDPREYAFTNPDLTVNLRREAAGEWIGLDAMTHFQAHGLGMAESRLWDEQGVIGNGNQNLLLQHQG